MTGRRGDSPFRPVQTGFTFPLGVFDRRPPAAPADQSSNQVVPSRGASALPGIDTGGEGSCVGADIEDVAATTEPPAPELRTVYDDDQRAPGIDAEDEPDPPDEGE